MSLLLIHRFMPYDFLFILVDLNPFKAYRGSQKFNRTHVCILNVWQTVTHVGSLNRI
jgi:hypothetical protein